MSKEKLKKQKAHLALRTSKQNGITLIALIITIIVMLILTGVTLSITLGDNGLVNKAKEATEATQIAMDRELLLSAVVGAIGEDGKVNLSAIVLPEGFTGSNGTYTSKNGHTFTVSANGEIVYTGEGNNGDNIIDNGGDKPSVEEPTTFSWNSVNLDNIDTNAEYKGYIAPFNLTIIVQPLEDGRMLIHDGAKVIEIDAKDEENIDKETGNLSFIVQLMGNDTNIVTTMNGENIDAYIQGLGTVTYVKQAKTIYTNEEVLNALGITNSSGTYNGTWAVIGNDNGNKKLVSTSDVTSYTLGYKDPKAVGADEFEKAIWSYKNAVNSLNTAAQEATGITNARSIKIEDIYDIIGEENIKKGTEYGKVYNYYYNTETSTVYSKYKTGDNTWSEPYNTNSSSQTFVNDNGETVVVDSAGDEVTLKQTEYIYDLTEEQRKEMRIVFNDEYWMSSPCVYCSSDFMGLRISYMYYGKLNNDNFCYSYGYVNRGVHSNGVRAVVSVPGL